MEKCPFVDELPFKLVMFHSSVRLPLVCPIILAVCYVSFTHWHGGQVAEVPALICMGQQCAQLLATIRHRPCVRAKSWCVGEGGKTCKTWHFYGVVLCEIQGKEGRKQKEGRSKKNRIKETRKGTKKEEKTVTNEMEKNPYFTCYKFTLKTKIIEVPYCSIQLPPDCGNFPGLKSKICETSNILQQLVINAQQPNLVTS